MTGQSAFINVGVHSLKQSYDRDVCASSEQLIYEAVSSASSSTSLQRSATAGTWDGSLGKSATASKTDAACFLPVTTTVCSTGTNKAYALGVIRKAQFVFWPTFQVDGHEVKRDACGCQEGFLDFGNFWVSLTEVGQNGPVSLGLQQSSQVTQGVRQTRMH